MKMAASSISLKARLILYNKDKILLLRQRKPKGGNYTLVGGNIERREFAKQALIRESYEEAGIIIKEKDLQLVHILHKIKKGEHRLVLYFKANHWEGKLKAKEPHKFKTVEWYNLAQLPDNITPTIKHVLEQFQSGNLYSELFQ